MKYEHICRRYSDDSVSRMVDTGCAYRITTTYKTYLPDIRYYYKGSLHRLDGPASIDLGGEIAFCANGTGYYSTKRFCEVAGMSDEETFMWVLMFGDRLPDTCKGFYGDDWRSIPVDKL